MVPYRLLCFVEQRLEVAPEWHCEDVDEDGCKNDEEDCVR